MIPINLVYDEKTCEGTFFIDNSSMEVFDTCDRAAQYKLSLKREANREKPALKFGGIIHKLLEHRYRNFDKSVVELIPELIDRAAQEFEKWTPPDGDYRNFAMAVDVIREYADKYNFESFDIVKLNDQPAIEVPFACPLTTIGIESEVAVWDNGKPRVVYLSALHIVWKGKIDLLTRREGRLYPLDHKTTSMMGPSYFNEFQISSQVYGYSWAAKQLIGEYPYGFIINALGVRAPTKTGKKLQFERSTVMIYRDLIDEWERDTTHKIADFIEGCRRGWLPKKSKWCSGKYGMCEYFGVCTLSPEMRATALSTNEFKDVTWDPLKTED